jgi:hypothetical protein
MLVCRYYIKLRDCFFSFIRDIRRVKKLVSGHEPTYEEYITQEISRALLDACKNINLLDIRKDSKFFSGDEGIWKRTTSVIHIHKPNRYYRKGPIL